MLYQNRFLLGIEYTKLQLQLNTCQPNNYCKKSTPQGHIGLRNNYYRMKLLKNLNRFLLGNYDKLNRQH